MGLRHRRFSNHDETKTQHRMCYCGHNRAEHEIFPDEHCYKCECKMFSWKKKKEKKK